MTARTKLTVLENTGSLFRIVAAVLLAWIAFRLLPHFPLGLGPDRLLIVSVLVGLYGYGLATHVLERFLDPVLDRLEDRTA